MIITIGFYYFSVFIHEIGHYTFATLWGSNVNLHMTLNSAYVSYSAEILSSIQKYILASSGIIFQTLFVLSFLFITRKYLSKMMKFSFLIMLLLSGYTGIFGTLVTTTDFTKMYFIYPNISLLFPLFFIILTIIVVYKYFVGKNEINSIKIFK